MTMFAKILEKMEWALILDFTTSNIITFAHQLTSLFCVLYTPKHISLEKCLKLPWICGNFEHFRAFFYNGYLTYQVA